jgi:prepilin signal peptidase PulO-like enzyme (type II secretory pathway)
MVELTTAVMFVLFIDKWEPGWYLLGMLTLGCTLITVSITDIKERVIPHDITYPAILAGLVFSTLLRNDLIGAMVGVGASYITFDCLAHYGLKLYLLSASRRMHLDEELQKPSILTSDLPEHDIQILGGGDAVLAAVIAAWLGWQKLLIAIPVSIFIGIIIGTIMRLREIQLNGSLSKYSRLISICVLSGFLMVSFSVAAVYSFNSNALPEACLLGLVGAFIGLLVGIVAATPGFSKPFPFGPALAAGGFAAMLC